MQMLTLLLTLASFIFSFNLNAEEKLTIHPYSKNCTDKRKAPVAICAIFQNEAAFLKEWIEYHRLIGISHFYLYNNLSEDHYLEELHEYINTGIVELFDVPFDSRIYANAAQKHNWVQIQCYSHALELAKGKNKWLAIIDTDEFICLTSETNLPRFLEKFKNAGGLVVYWQLYGTSNVWDLAFGDLLIEKLVYKFPHDYGENWLYKSIVQPKYARCHSPHGCRYSKGKYAVVPNLKRFHHGKPYAHIPIEDIRINHYTFRTEKFYQEVKKPRRAIWGYVPSAEMEKERMDLANSVYDPAMLKFTKALKQRLFTPQG